MGGKIYSHGLGLRPSWQEKEGQGHLSSRWDRVRQELFTWPLAGRQGQQKLGQG